MDIVLGYIYTWAIVSYGLGSGGFIVFGTFIGA